MSDERVAALERANAALREANAALTRSAFARADAGGASALSVTGSGPSEWGRNTLNSVPRPSSLSAET